MGQLAQLPARQRAIGHRYAQHIGMQLQIEPVHQPERAELVFAQFARQAAVYLISELCAAARDKRGVKFIISIHDRPPPAAGGQRWRRSVSKALLGRWRGSVRAAAWGR